MRPGAPPTVRRLPLGRIDAITNIVGCLSCPRLALAMHFAKRRRVVQRRIADTSWRVLVDRGVPHRVSDASHAGAPVFFGFALPHLTAPRAFA
jgi:hypothetical protein